ncbi:50S ribosomal protein L21 [Lentisphaerota bacterium WC36G]|nr:50S ribosomal protein L21 [Lentisphaerae bacterium WC36]
MYAVIKTGGKQYKVEVGQTIDIERIAIEDGKVTFNEVLAVGEESGELKVGAPLLEGVTVEAELEKEYRGKKLIVFKMKRRKGYRKKKGHRQELTQVKITAINA